MDSNNYDTLLQAGGVWTAADPDGSGTTWSPGSGGNCQRTLFVCEKPSNPNNWVFTQYISKNVTTLSNMSIFVNVTVRFSTCNPSCPKSLNIFYFKVNSPVALPNTSNFSLLSTIIGTTTVVFDAVISFNIKPDEAGFYIALQDRGSCTNLNRVKVYYYQCPAQQVGLTLYPLTPASTKQNSPVLVTASCVTGSANLSSLYLQCDNYGAWNGSANCSCNIGYRPMGSSCTGCGAGQWLDAKNLTCSPCPGNCSLDLVMTSICPCLDGYFRASMEGPDVGCTSPPTVPNNLMITSITNTSISLMWEKPDVIGRDDYYFAVKYRTDSSLKFITAFKVIDKSNVIAYTLHNLTSYTSYEISVTAVNGVSDQDWYNDCIRTATITAATLEGVPGVIDIAVIGQYVVWQRPIFPNGLIIGYSLQVVAGSQSRQIITVNATTFIYQVPSTNILSGGGNTYVQVSAQTNAGNGEWSIPQLLKLPLPECTTSQTSALLSFTSNFAVSFPSKSSTSPTSQPMEENGIQQNMMQIYLGVATGVIFAVVGAITAGVFVTVYIVRRDYKRKKLELAMANASASRKTDKIDESPL
eukprot:Em0008g335a